MPETAGPVANARSIARLKTFVQYVRAGRRLSQDSGETHAVVEKIAEAVIRLARIAEPAFSTDERRRNHRYVLDFLDSKDAAKTAYINTVQALAVDCATLTEDAWIENWRPAVTQVVQDSIGATLGGEDIADFLEWGDAAG